MSTVSEETIAELKEIYAAADESYRGPAFVANYIQLQIRDELREISHQLAEIDETLDRIYISMPES